LSGGRAEYLCSRLESVTDALSQVKTYAYAKDDGSVRNIV
jgi:hypothetical protein